jgi:hypothetical protein
MDSTNTEYVRKGYNGPRVTSEVLHEPMDTAKARGSRWEG